MKVTKFLPCAVIFPILALLALPVLCRAQILRGTIRNADNGLPVASALVIVQGQRPDAVAAEARTDSAGRYAFGPLRPGYYTCRIEAEGFDHQTIAEINVAAGKERLLEVGLRRAASQLPEVTISADQPGRRPTQPLSEIPLTRDQTLRFPATFFDPARLAMAYPGVAQTDDGVNSISIRGNSPATVRWRLEGADVVNPNHLPNGGTINDRPAAASGGVLMFSSQLLDNSALLTGAFPAGYGDAISGVMDMHLRPGNNRQREYTVQASLIGLDIAAEGPLGKGSRAPSYLANYRYSTVGLLSQMGVSFGDEQIGFQDLSFHLHFPTKKGGSWSVFGTGGLSENIFRHKVDSLEIKIDKDRYDIDFQSGTGILGGSGQWRWGRRTVANMTVAGSFQVSDWSKVLANEDAIFSRDERLDYRQLAILSGRIDFQHTWGRFRLSEGLQTAQNYFLAETSTRLPLTGFNYFTAEGSYDLLQPWVTGAWTSTTGKWIAQAGLHVMFDPSYFEGAIDPRASLTARFSARHSFFIAGGLYSQALPAWMWDYLSSPFLRSPQVALGHTWRPGNALKVHTEVYFQYQKRYPATPSVSWFNQPEQITPDFFRNGFESDARTYGLETGVEKTLQRGWFLLTNVSLFRSNFRFHTPSAVGPWLRSRWDIGHLANLTLGKEWTRDRPAEKVRAFGLNGRLVWTGGPREAQLDLDAPTLNGAMVSYQENTGYTRQNADYFRIDLRAYWKRSLGDRRNSTFAMDLQNVTMQQNVAYRYFDPLTQKVETKYQLGLIPNISWRLEF